MKAPLATPSDSTLVIEGNDLQLTVLGRNDVSADYLSWLNDAHVLRFRNPKVFPMTMSQLEAWVEGIPASGDLVLAIRTRIGRRHIGNIALGMIQSKHRSAELSVMIGALAFGTPAIALLTTRFPDDALAPAVGRVAQPGFQSGGSKTGWVAEGIKREAFLLNGEYTDSNVGRFSIVNDKLERVI